MHRGSRAIGPARKRLLHVLQSPSTSIPTSLNVSHLIKSVPELRDGEIINDETTFEVIDSKLLRVGLAPSTELYTKRNTLLASFGDSLVSTFYLAKSLSRLWAFQRPFGYQRLISSAPVCTLISSSNPLAVVTLDGTIDWVVVSNNALHTFTGERLIVQAKRKPLFFANTRRKIGFSHTFLSGRGTIALSGTGNLYKVTLDQGESFLALKDSLVAYSIDSNNKNVLHSEYHELPFSAATDSGESTGYEVQGGNVWDRVKQMYHLVAGTLSNMVNSDSGKYIRLHGPTTMLLSNPTSKYVVPEFEANLNVNPLEQKVHSTAQQLVEEQAERLQLQQSMGMTGRPEDHLKVATVKDGKVTFESTKTFDQFQ